MQSKNFIFPILERGNFFESAYIRIQCLLFQILINTDCRKSSILRIPIASTYFLISSKFLNSWHEYARNIFYRLAATLCENEIAVKVAERRSYNLYSYFVFTYNHSAIRKIFFYQSLKWNDTAKKQYSPLLTKYR